LGRGTERALRSAAARPLRRALSIWSWASLMNSRSGSSAPQCRALLGDLVWRPTISAAFSWVRSTFAAASSRIALISFELHVLAVDDDHRLDAAPKSSDCEAASQQADLRWRYIVRRCFA
jgi:hypothetical protein